jgi:hypothetical protein
MGEMTQLANLQEDTAIFNDMKLKINPKSVNIIALQLVVNTCIFKATSSA